MAERPRQPAVGLVEIEPQRFEPPGQRLVDPVAEIAGGHCPRPARQRLDSAVDLTVDLGLFRFRLAAGCVQLGGRAACLTVLFHRDLGERIGFEDAERARHFADLVGAPSPRHVGVERTRRQSTAWPW